jgi:DNA mismatch repair protein MutS
MQTRTTFRDLSLEHREGRSGGPFRARLGGHLVSGHVGGGGTVLRVAPQEICVPDSHAQEPTLRRIYAGAAPPHWNARPASQLDFHGACRDLEAQFGESAVHALVEKGYRNALCAAGGLLRYLEETQRRRPRHLHGISDYQVQEFMILDEAAKRNLEIVQSWMERSKKNSLLGVLDLTLTSMGARKLRNWIQYPLLKVEAIEARLDAVEELKDREIDRAAIRSGLQGIQDLERLNSKVSLGVANPRDLASLKNSLQALPPLRARLEGFQSGRIREILGLLDPLEDVVALLDRALAEKPHLALSADRVSAWFVRALLIVAAGVLVVTFGAPDAAPELGP